METENPTIESPAQRTHLFLVRVWRESARGDRTEIRGKAQHVLTGEVHYFRDWAALGAFMAAQMGEGEDGSVE